ncbi:mevalonate kinase [Pendulispora rubella]|uniref:Mevalonate kinase n=1 Tax=Pendulispora rubella TaxID=2741070 RepID=A0ABZ2LEY9_9BACT
MSTSIGYGKIILLGEHAVVYGYPAVAAALERRVQIETRRGSGMVILSGGSAMAMRKRLPSGGPREEDSFAWAYQAIISSLGIEPSAIHHDFVVTSDIPPRSGLGSSAALAVALARALDSALGLGASERAIAAAAHAAESVFHGNPSGIDHAIAQYGGFGVYRKGTGLVPLRANPFTLCVGQSGRSRDTRTCVQRVARLHRDNPSVALRSLEALGLLAQSGVDAILRGDRAALGRAMNHNQEELSVLGVSCDEIDAMCVAARRAGALGVKLTGGGGGGSVIALADDPERVRGAWKQAGFESFVAAVGGAQPLETAGAA